MRTARIALLVGLLAGQANAGLIHEFIFSTGLSDSAGSAAGVAFNGADVNAGRLVLDGSRQQFVEFGSLLVPTTGSYSVVMDMRATFVPPDYVELISQGYSRGPGFYIGQNPHSVFRVGDTYSDTTVLFPTDGDWHQVAVIVDAVANISRLVVDGSAKNIGPALATTSVGQNTRLGGQYFSYGEFFTGSLDNVRIFDNALTLNALSDLGAGGARSPAAIHMPEPNTFVLMAMGGLALLAGGRRRKRRDR